MTKRQIREDWNSAAAAYEQFITAPDSCSQCIEWPCIRLMLPDLKGKRILDLGCGTGTYTFLLEEYAPIGVIGIDLSDEMLRIARAKARLNGSAAAFIRGDAKRAYLLAGAGYDFVFSATTAHYIRDLEAFMTSISQCMKPGGICILSVIHPVCSAHCPVDRDGAFPTVEDWQMRYHDKSVRAHIPPWIQENDAEDNRLSRSYHHTFGDYVNAALGVGLTLCDVQEPLPPQSWRRTLPDRYESLLAKPVYMILKFQK